MKKAVIVKVNNGTSYVLFNDGIPVKADIFYDDEEHIMGNIYVGYICDIAKNINAAFVEYEAGKKAYLPLNSDSENSGIVYLNRKNSAKPACGDRVIIQISKEAIKTKFPVCTACFELNSKYAVLRHGINGISFSKKITDSEFKNALSKLLLSEIDELNNNADFGILIRTDSYETDIPTVVNSVRALIDEYKMIISVAKTRPKNYLLKSVDKPLIAAIKTLKLKNTDIIVTDNENIFEELKSHSLDASLEYYKDDLLPLYKLNSLEKIFEDIKSRKVWLKSGGYLIIDYTEAMTVIDVNSGKCNAGKDREKNFFKINMEAAKEIARQLSLRNISGIIIIDFIDMQNKENIDYLYNSMIDFVSDDPVKTNVVDITKLNLMELTRKKTSDRVFVRENLF